MGSYRPSWDPKGCPTLAIQPSGTGFDNFPVMHPRRERTQSRGLIFLKISYSVFSEKGIASTPGEKSLVCRSFL